MTDPIRVVQVADLFEWLPANHQRGAVVTGLPDAAELGLDHDRWTHWYYEAARLAFRASTGPTIIFATDRKRDGQWIPKDSLLMEAAAHQGAGPLLWHRIALTRPVGHVDLHRPTYTHLLCWGPGRPGSPRPDVIPHGRRLSRVSIGMTAAAHIMSYLVEVGVTAVLNPACGFGTILAMANAAGLDAFGCDISLLRVEQSREQGVQDELWAPVYLGPNEIHTGWPGPTVSKP